MIANACRFICLLALILNLHAAAAATTSYSNPLSSLGSNPADPCIVYDNGLYLLYPTEDGTNYYYWQSTNAVTWTKKTKIYGPGTSGSTWAPDVHYDASLGKYVLYWSKNHTWGAATSATATGTFTDVAGSQFPVSDGIDVNSFVDTDGKLYLYWPNSANTIMMRSMTSATATTCGDSRLVLHYTGNAYGEDRAVCEGPVVFRFRDTYFMLYSSGTYSDASYRVLYASAKNPTGPWIKRGILQQTDSAQGIYGPGHGCVFVDAAGQMWHMYQQLTLPGKMPRQQAIDKLNVDPATMTLSVVMTRGGSQTGPLTTGGAAYPTSILTAPTYGSVVAQGAVVTLSANVTAPGGTVNRVDFYANETLVGTATSAPYSISYTASTAGRVWIEARCVDSNNALAKSPQNLLIVGNRPPMVAFASPAANSYANTASSVVLTVSASDPDGSVSSVAYYADGNLVGTASGAPWQVTWTAGSALYSVLKAVATDNQGMTTDTSIGIYLRDAQKQGVQIYEPFNYTLGATGPTPTFPASPSATDATGALSGKVGFTATSWGASTQVVAGLSYANSGGTLTATANALQVTGANASKNSMQFWNWADYYGRDDPLSYLRGCYGDAGVYDPLGLGWTGGGPTQLYVSCLMRVNSTTAGLSALIMDQHLGSSGFNDQYIGASNGQWILQDRTNTPVNLGAVTANEVNLFVIRYSASGPNATVVDVWSNPTLGPTLGAPTGSYTYNSWVSVTYFGYTAATANAFTMDELRVGPTLASVMPYTPTVGSYGINATSGANGTVTPTGTTTVLSGGSQTYTITPNNGYEIASLIVDGSTVMTASSYTFTNVTSSHTIAASFRLIPATPSVAGVRLFYNRSAWDGNDAGASSADDSAIATDKTPLLPGQTATFANYTSYGRGLNGLMIDIANIVGTPTASDFAFTVGNDSNPAGWSAASAPTSITVRSGAGTSGSSRITLIWADGAITKKWLRAQVNATAATGLATPYVFYVGNAIGEVGNSASDAIVSGLDQLQCRLHSTSPGAAAITNQYDINRDQAVSGMDQLLIRNNSTAPGSALLLIAPP